MSGICYINGTDVADYGLDVVSLGSAWSGPQRRRAAASPYGLLGAYAATEATVEPRVLELGMALDTTRAARVGLLDDVHRLFTGLLEIELGDAPGRIMYGLLETSETSGRYGGPESWLTDLGDLGLRWRIVCHNAARYTRETSIVGFGSTDVEIPLGTAPSTGVITIYGSATDPDITYTDSAGEPLLPVSGDTVTMGFTRTLASDEALEIDLGAQTVTLIDSGVRTEALSTLTSGWFFRLDPADGRGEDAVYPKLNVSAGNASIRYRKAWLS